MDGGQRGQSIGGWVVRAVKAERKTELTARSTDGRVGVESSHDR